MAKNKRTSGTPAAAFMAGFSSAGRAESIPRATLADRENREQSAGLPNPYEVAAVVAHELTRDEAIARAVEARRQEIAAALDDKWSQPPTHDCTQGCGRRWHTAYLATVCCANRNSRAIRISSPLDIALPEDRAASQMFDGDEPPEAEPVVDHAAYVSGLERDAQSAHEELQRVMAERDCLRAQLDAAHATIAALLEGGVR